MKNKIIILILSLSFFFSGCTSSSSSLQKFSMNFTDTVFNTFISFTGYTKDEATFESFASMIKEEFSYYNQLFDKYNTYEGINNIKTINDQAGIAPVKVDKDIIELLLLSKQFSELTQGKFDITMGPVLEIWHQYREEGMKANEENRDTQLPSLESLEAAKQLAGWENVEINEAESSVYLTKVGASLDVGSVAKGFATEKIARKLEAEGFSSGIINAGGNVRLVGQKPDQTPWKVGVQVPNLTAYSSDSLMTISLPSAASFVTSGDYQRFYYHEGKLIHHIIDPATLMPANYYRAVTVIEKDNQFLADILSTALFTLPYEDGKQLIASLKNQGHQIEAIWVFDETTPLPNQESGNIIESKNYKILTTEGVSTLIE